VQEHLLVLDVHHLKAVDVVDMNPYQPAFNRRFGKVRALCHRFLASLGLHCSLLACMQYRNVSGIKDYTTALSHGVDRVNLLGTKSAHMLRPNTSVLVS
jgi:hypothetical protein